MGKNVDNKKIFKDAAQAAVNEIIPIIIDSEIAGLADRIYTLPDAESIQIETAVDLIDEEETNWDELRKAIDGKYAKKFMDILESLPDREFVRSYLKVLEYVKPKVTRKEEALTGDIDNSITIQVLQILPNGEKRIIELKDDATLLQD